MKNNKKIKYFTAGIMLVGSIFLVSAVSVLAVPAPFLQNLKIGSTGSQVLMLQKVLNRNPKTQVATSGPGSPGSETSYFGSLTKRAVIAFQNLYSKDVLAPVGLNYGTGYVGPSTRKRLNLITNGIGIDPDKPVEYPKIPRRDTIINRIEPASGAPGQFVSLYGVGFEGDESIAFSGAAVVKPSFAGDSSTLVFSVPRIDAGIYNVAVVYPDPEGITNQVKFEVTEGTRVSPGVTKPEIDDISPRAGRKGTTLTITGSNFDPTGNTVYLSYGTIENALSIDGKTISVEITPVIPAFAGNEDGSIRLPFWIYVANTKGLSGHIIFEYIP